MLKPIKNDRSAKWHLEKFIEFTEFKRQAGEPSPHLATVVCLSKGENWLEKVWRVGCYAVPYSVLSAEILWTYWNYDKAKDSKRVTEWLRKHWGHFHIRTERRCVRSLDFFTRSLLGYHEWITDSLKPFLDRCTRQGTHIFYQKLWKVINEVPYFGRYICIRAIECLRRLEILDARLFDIRAIGGHSPIRALTLFYPEHKAALLGEDEKVIVSCGEALVKTVGKRVTSADYYVCAAMLCEYRKAFEDGSEYPARTQDAELEYYNKYIPYWNQLGFLSGILGARRKTFNNLCLGEIQGWVGVRKDLNISLSDRGYNWSDTKYVFTATKDFSNPAVRK